MNNKEIENNIRVAFEKIQPNQLDSILSNCKRNEVKTIFMKEKEKHFWAPRLALFAASFAIVLLTIFGVNAYSNSQNAVFATISLDVNPSIEIKINKNEKVLDVIALNEDAKLIVGDMNFKGSNLDVTVNALIGSLVRNGYIDDLHNSILVSVDDLDDVAGKSLEEKLMAEISELLDKGSVLAQQVKTNKEIQELADKYDITLGKAQMIKELADKTTLYNYEDLAKLSINELNLLSKNIDDTSIQRNGDPSDKAYIGTEKAKEIALIDLGVKEADVTIKKVKLDYENNKMVYEVEFVNNNVEYEYEIDALTGDIIYVDREYERKAATTPNNNQTTTTTNNAGVSALISEAKAKQTALANAGVSESDITGYRIKRDYDDGVVKYEIDFYVGNVEYEYEINATTGAIIKAEKELEDDYRPTSSSQAGVYNYSGNTYKVENGVVYEYDDGKWEPEYDKKVSGGVVYEYDDERWEPDKKTENGVTYEYDNGRWEPDSKVENGTTYEYDDGHWEVDDDDDHDDDDRFDFDDDFDDDDDD